jgi:transposase-like protein
MAKKGFKIAAEIKIEIINKLKHDGLSVSDAAKQYGISDKTIYKRARHQSERFGQLARIQQGEERERTAQTNHW